MAGRSTETRYSCRFVTSSVVQPRLRLVYLMRVWAQARVDGAPATELQCNKPAHPAQSALTRAALTGTEA